MPNEFTSQSNQNYQFTIKKRPQIFGVAQKNKLQTFSISWPNINRFSNVYHQHILWKICSKVVAKHATTVSLHYLVKYKFPKTSIVTINTYGKKYLIKQPFTIFLFKLNYV